METTAKKRTRGRPRGTGADKAALPVQALDRGLTLLAALSEAGKATLTELSDRAVLAPSTTHRLLSTMQFHGIVEFDDTSQEWVVGVEAFRIGSSFSRRVTIVEAGRGVMRDLMQATGETANLGIADHGEVVFISQVESDNPIHAFFRLGTRGQMHASGIGKALLAEYRREEVERVVHRHGLTSFTARSITAIEALVDDLAETRRRGWALDDEERTVGMRCLAAPIFNEYGEAAAGISISGPSARMTPEKLDELGPLVAEAARRVTQAIGGGRAGPE